MSAIWLYFSIFVIAIICITFFCQGYYGNKQAESILGRISYGVIYLSILVIVYGGFSAIIYFFVGTLNVNISLIVATAPNLILSESTAVFAPIVKEYAGTYSTATAFILCLLTPLVLIGSIFFAIFGGAGMAFFPVELILSYFSQPTKPSAEEYVLSKKIMLQSSERIITKIKEAYDLRRDLDLNPITNPVEKKMKLKILNEKTTEMKKELAEYEEVFMVFKAQDNILDNNPLVYLAYLIIGILFLLLSLLFIIHTFMSLKGFYIIFDGFFRFLAGLSSLFALTIFIFVSVFVLLSITKGSIKLLGSLGTLVGLLPFKLNATWTDTFFVNNQFLLLSLFGMINYFARFMPTFFRFMSAVLIFNQVINKISFVNAIFKYNILEYVFIGFFLIGGILLLFTKSPKAILDEKIKEEQVKLEAEKERLKEMEDGAKNEKKDEPKK